MGLDAIGGSAACERIINRWQDIMSDHVLLREFFGPEAKAPEARQRQDEYFLAMMTSADGETPVDSSGRSLQEIHQHLCIDSYLFGAFIRCLRKALAEHNVQTPSADIFVAVIEAQR